MHWVEEQDGEDVAVPAEVVDLSFAIECKALPVDHAWALFEALAPLLPWLEQDPLAGIHPLHVAESAHGWQRPEAPDALLHLSRRTKLVLRLPQERVAQAAALTGQTIDIAGHGMTLGEATQLPLSRSTSLFARRVVIEENEEEEHFLRRQIDVMHAMGVRPKKVLPGLSHPLRTPLGQICVRLLSLEGLTVEESFVLQMHGLGPARHLGCGIFIAHKPLSKVQI
ncbi:MAG: type I-MYXAN CRISPR-associated protein Cas6/Cmx6 [Gammaproteobacteria bacterium]|nr:type I-MYXAN CRISPR-associated protein Cas6/Cmx6 [Gammaproteobacteria bacterium]